MPIESKSPESLTGHSDSPGDATPNLPAISILGLGSMGGSILSGLRSPDVHTHGPIRITTSSAASAKRFADATDVSAESLEENADANRAVVRGAQVILLAVKPWMILDVIREVAADLEPGSIVVSVAAGITLDSMTELLPNNVTAIRAMPNTPSLIGLGVTGVAATPQATEEAVTIAHDVFATVGEVLVVPESQIDALSAVSGSGPAYVYWFTEQLTSAAERLGFTHDQAKLLAENTVIGAANLMKTSDEEPAQLRRNVTSPNGTTEQAINVFLGSDFATVADEALAAAVRRSQELADGN
ncbi:MAG: pyrroline-5-carboxylate reductase [Canibacter sp.]